MINTMFPCIRFQLTTLFVALTVMCCLFGALSQTVRAIMNRQACIARIESMGGYVYYTDQEGDGEYYSHSASGIPGPAILRPILGKDAFRKVDVLYLWGAFCDDDLAMLKHLPATRLLALNCRNGNITDRSVEYIARLKNLESLSVTGTQITETGKLRIRKALPGIVIGHCETFSFSLGPCRFVFRDGDEEL